LEVERDRGLTQPNIKPYEYPPMPLSIGTFANAFQEQRVQEQLGLGVIPYSERVNLDKIIAEIQLDSIRKSQSILRIWETRLDMKEYHEAHLHDIYQHITTEIELISTKMNIESGISYGAFCMGGSGLQKIISKGNSVSRETNVYNGIRPIGLVGGKFNSYLIPTFDEEFPLVDKDGNVNTDTKLNVYHQLHVFGKTLSAGNHIVLGALNKSFRRENVGIDKNSERYTMIEGEFMSRLNEDPKTHYLGYTLLIKGL